jgi:hypothetical protein
LLVNAEPGRDVCFFVNTDSAIMPDEMRVVAGSPRTWHVGSRSQYDARGG